MGLLISLRRVSFFCQIVGGGQMRASNPVSDPRRGLESLGRRTIIAVGVAWRGSFGDRPTKRNSFALEELLPLFDVERIQFISLQDDVSADELIFFERLSPSILPEDAGSLEPHRVLVGNKRTVIRQAWLNLRLLAEHLKGR